MIAPIIKLLRKFDFLEQLLLALILSSVISLILFFPYFQNGDSSIYLTFAKSMWTRGLFYFGPEGPWGGATSPLWALMLSLPYLFTTNVSFVIIFGKLLAVFFYFLSLVFIYKSYKLLFLGSTNKALFLSIAAVFLVEPMLRYFTLVLFETSFAISLRNTTSN